MSSNNITDTGVVAEATLQPVEPTLSVNKEESAATQIKNHLPDPQVKLGKNKKPRRSFSQSYKKRILAAFEACPDATERKSISAHTFLNAGKVLCTNKISPLSKSLLKHPFDVHTFCTYNILYGI